MLRRYVMIINILLIAGSLFILSKIFKIWKTDDYLNLASMKKANAANIPALKVSFAPSNPRNAYKEIADKDLFRPERTEWKSPTKEETDSSSEASPKLIVFGIVITSDSKYALIKEQDILGKLIKISEGDEINGLKVIAIEPNAIRVKDGDKTIRYALIQPGKPKTRAIPSKIIRSQPKNSPRLSTKTGSGPVPALAPQSLAVSPPSPLPEKK